MVNEMISIGKHSQLWEGRPVTSGGGVSVLLPYWHCEVSVVMNIATSFLTPHFTVLFTYGVYENNSTDVADRETTQIRTSVVDNSACSDITECTESSLYGANVWQVL